MPRVAPAARICLVEAVTSLQRLRREMGRLSETDEDYKKKKRALEAVIKELQSVPDGEAQAVSSAQALTQSSHKERLGSLSRSRSKSSSRPAHRE
jgi:hypothetical protein